ncbi:hypothetical protein [Marinobacterium rhizophilum]|uniref:Uncharacterized protein n=1 Tax=Marinobacterium rhizophilum TaxID=420402 RepID=A0ABY5HJD1_9GAMM|nr:hypothetical protein [Marinobacterium rhizophilum]UTW12219.1 hypothetical protein KDW95_00580 [Marinobacterium rhizophilum]
MAGQTAVLCFIGDPQNRGPWSTKPVSIPTFPAIGARTATGAPTSKRPCSNAATLSVAQLIGSPSGDTQEHKTGRQLIGDYEWRAEALKSPGNSEAAPKNLDMAADLAKRLEQVRGTEHRP